MPRESYAAAMARLTKGLDELFLRAVALVPDANVRHELIRVEAATVAEIERLTSARMERSVYEQQRRDGSKVVEMALVRYPRG